MASDKGTDLAASLKTAQNAIGELAKFMETRVRPLLKERDFESALKNVAPPKGGKGIKHILRFIDDKVNFIKNTMNKP